MKDTLKRSISFLRPLSVGVLDMRTALSVDCRGHFPDRGHMFVGRQNEEQNECYLSD